MRAILYLYNINIIIIITHTRARARTKNRIIILCRVAGNKETFAGGRAEGCARDTGGGRPWPLQQMLDCAAATATAGRVLLRLYYTRILACVCVCV